MRVTVLTLSDPLAGRHGGTLRIRGLAEAIASLGHETLCLFPSLEDSHNWENGAQFRGVKSRPAGSRRWPAWAINTKRAFLPMPTSAGARSLALQASLADSSCDLLVITSQSQLGYQGVQKDAKMWVDFSDLWSDFARRQMMASGRIAALVANAQRSRLEVEEMAVARSATICTAAGWADGLTLQTRTGVSVQWLPTPIPELGESRDKGLTERTGEKPVAGFLANFGYEPNRDAFRLLCEQWVPTFRRAGWTVLVAGHDSQELGCADVEVLGAVPGVADFYERVDVALAPIRLGGGMKVKVVEAIAFGKPVIGTEFAGEGFPESIRSQMTIVGDAGPSVEGLANYEIVAPDRGVLEPFHPRFFTDTVRELLAQADELDRSS